MSPVTHLLLSWELSFAARLGRRDRALVVFAGLAPDLDGIGVLVDFAAPLWGAETSLYATYHHFLFHGGPGALLVAAVAWACAERRPATVLIALIAFHLHLLCDLVGSRGPDALWPIYYLGPFSRALPLQWSGQWALNAWPNLLISAAVLVQVYRRAVSQSLSPVSVVSTRWDALFVGTLRRWDTRLFRRT